MGDGLICEKLYLLRHPPRLVRAVDRVDKVLLHACSKIRLAPPWSRTLQKPALGADRRVGRDQTRHLPVSSWTAMWTIGSRRDMQLSWCGVSTMPLLAQHVSRTAPCDGLWTGRFNVESVIWYHAYTPPHFHSTKSQHLDHFRRNYQ